MRNEITTKKYAIVYKTTNLVNGMIYIGSHQSDLLQDAYLGSGKALNKDIRTYGKQNFARTNLFVYNNIEQARAMQKQIVNRKFVKRTDTYNMSIGGLGQRCGKLHTFKDKHHTKATKTAMKLDRQNQVFMNKDGKNARIHCSERDQYILRGWDNGRTHNWRSRNK